MPLRQECLKARRGGYRADNYLPAHALCNNYRWDYTSEEFQHILKLGVWLRTQIERKTPLGLRAAKSFLAPETVRESRRKTTDHQRQL